MKYIMTRRYEIISYDTMRILVPYDNQDDAFILSEMTEVVLSHLKTPASAQDLANILVARLHLSQEEANSEIQSLLTKLLKERFVQQVE